MSENLSRPFFFSLERGENNSVYNDSLEGLFSMQLYRRQEKMAGESLCIVCRQTLLVIFCQFLYYGANQNTMLICNAVCLKVQFS